MGKVSTPHRRLKREDRARILFERGHVRPYRDTSGSRRIDWYLVDADSRPEPYRVEVGGDFVYCQCQDWQALYEMGFAGKCKHSLAVLAYRSACAAGFRRSA